jgi:hypothetical protein
MTAAALFKWQVGCSCAHERLAKEAEEARRSELDKQLVAPQHIKDLEVGGLDGIALMLVHVHGERHGGTEEQYLALSNGPHDAVLLGDIPHALPHLWNTPQRHFSASVLMLEQNRQATEEAADRKMRHVFALMQSTTEAPHTMGGRDVGGNECR